MHSLALQRTEPFYKWLNIFPKMSALPVDLLYLLWRLLTLPAFKVDSKALITTMDGIHFCHMLSTHTISPNFMIRVIYASPSFRKWRYGWVVESSPTINRVVRFITSYTHTHTQNLHKWKKDMESLKDNIKVSRVIKWIWKEDFVFLTLTSLNFNGNSAKAIGNPWTKKEPLLISL